ncbi:MAG TPA: AAA family ATPase, partial [Candidatus Paceibacterota bacterium]|nr:AAA family ATPase [Candidatus Paceibacterota bacterium]
SRFLNKDSGLRQAVAGDKPPATLLFIGPIGSGKMHLIKSFTRMMFMGNENAFVRVNCTLFHEGMVTQEKIDQPGFEFFARLEAEESKDKAEKELAEIDEEYLAIEQIFKDKIINGADQDDCVRERDEKVSHIIERQKEVVERHKKFVQSIKWQPGRDYPSVVVIEGIDEMHPGIVNVLKEILDSGRFRNANGEVVYFGNCFIFLKCNLMSEDFTKPQKMGFDTGNADDSFNDLYKAATQKLLRILSMELLKEIGKENIVVFRPFSKKELMDIIDRKLSVLGTIVPPGDDESSVSVVFTDNAKRHIYNEARDRMNKMFGAAPIDRIISLRICNKLDKVIANKEYDVKGGDTLRVDAANGEIVFYKDDKVLA